MGNFFVYIVRFAVLDWGPTMLKEHLHMDISHAGWTVAAFEIAGIAGMLAAGWATDRFFGGRAPRTCVICMLMTALCLVGLYTLNEHTPLAVAIAIPVSYTHLAKQLNPAYDGMTDQQVKRFKYWEFRTMAMCIFGYALFYFVRKNLSIAMPYLNEEMGISKSDLGLFLTLHGLISVSYTHLDVYKRQGWNSTPLPAS